MTDVGYVRRVPPLLGLLLTAQTAREIRLFRKRQVISANSGWVLSSGSLSIGPECCAPLPGAAV